MVQLPRHILVRQSLWQYDFGVAWWPSEASYRQQKYPISLSGNVHSQNAGAKHSQTNVFIHSTPHSNLAWILTNPKGRLMVQMIFSQSLTAQFPYFRAKYDLLTLCLSVKKRLLVVLEAHFMEGVTDCAWRNQTNRIVRDFYMVTPVPHHIAPNRPANLFWELSLILFLTGLSSTYILRQFCRTLEMVDRVKPFRAVTSCCLISARCIPTMVAFSSVIKQRVFTVHKWFDVQNAQ